MGASAYIRLALLGLLFAMALPVRGQHAIGEAGGFLWTVRLTDGAMTQIGPTGLVHRMEELAWTPGGRLLGLIDTGVEGELYEVDAQSGAATRLTSFPRTRARGLTVLADGRVFVSTEVDSHPFSGDIYELDPTTGMTRFVRSFTNALPALTDDGVRLLVFEDSAGTAILAVDPDSGQMNPWNDSDQLEFSPIAAMKGTAGDLWTLNRQGGVLAYSSFRSQRIPDLGIGTPESLDGFGFFFSRPEAGLSSIALLPPATPVAVPTGGRLIGVLSIFLLACTGWLVLSRR